jgi:predicted Fe-Mo cluster-binding NifX family protein
MRICIPTEDKNGPQSRINDHFGSAPYFALADTESGDVHVTPNAGGHHGHGQCEPIKHIDTNQLDAVVCRGLGKHALVTLTKGGVEVWKTYADTVRDAIEDAREGRLEKLTIQKACAGHGHGGGHQHER